MFFLKTNLLLRVNLCGIPCGQINQHIIFELTLVDLRSWRFQTWIYGTYPLTCNTFLRWKIFEEPMTLRTFSKQNWKKKVEKTIANKTRIYVNKSLVKELFFSKNNMFNNMVKPQEIMKKHKKKIPLDAPVPLCGTGTCALMAVWWVGRLALVGRLGPQKAWGGSMF